MAQDRELIWSTATDQSRLLMAGEVSAIELLDAHLSQIEDVNPKVNALVTLTPEVATSRARAADDAFAAGQWLGPLHGLVVAHKDLADTEGVRTTYGSTIFAHHVPERDALVVERQKLAGAVMVAKTNTPEFGAGSQTFNEIFGATRNPFDLERTSGGSSGGAAAALASAMVALADGSDMGGSLRNPAAFCNVVGFRPTPGRVPTWPSIMHWLGLGTAGPMGRTVDDVALLFSVLAGPDPRSPSALDAPGSWFAPPLSEPAPLRVAWAPDLGGLPIDPEIRSAMAAVPYLFEDMGHRVSIACPDLEGAREAFAVHRAIYYANALGPRLFEIESELKQTVIWNVDQGLALSGAQIRQAQLVRSEIFDRVAAFFQDFDLLLCPATQVPPFPVEIEWIDQIDGRSLETYIDWMRVCTDVTVMHCPAVSVPAGFTESGLPVGLQLVGPSRQDRLVLEVAKQFESTIDLGNVRPPAATKANPPAARKPQRDGRE